MESRLKERDSSLDLIKTLAAIGVVYVHYGYSYAESRYFTRSTIIVHLVYFLACSCVPLFFLVNGALCLNKNYPVKQCLEKAGKYLFKGLVYIPINVFLYESIKNWRILTPAEFINGVFHWYDNGITRLWFIWAIALLFLFLPFINTVCRSEGKSKYLYFLWIFLCTFGVETYARGKDIVNYFLGAGNGTPAAKDFWPQLNPFLGWNSFGIVYFIIGGFLYSRKSLWGG